MTKILSLKGASSSQLYLSTMYSVLKNGDELAPRGKKIREMRPAVIEFEDPIDRITQLENRKINPFFHAAECLWMILGRSDVEFLTAFNKNMASFSDDGVYFNAPYGERVRSWGKHDATGDIYNPLDQLYSVYRLLSADTDTRQAIATIGDPRYDNAEYLLDRGTRDVACNREMLFKIRNGKLDLTVTNRSNDVHWGLFTANLPVFTTFQELVASWLDIEPGVYTQFSDSMHLYLEDYGAKITEDLTGVYGNNDGNIKDTVKYEFKTEPRMKKRGMDESNDMLLRTEALIEDIVLNDDAILKFLESPDSMLETTFEEIKTVIDDPYFEMLVGLMLIYRVHSFDGEFAEKDGLTCEQVRINSVVTLLENIPASTWKRSALNFLSVSKRYEDPEVFTKLRGELDSEATTIKLKTLIRG